MSTWASVISAVTHHSQIVWGHSDKNTWYCKKRGYFIKSVFCSEIPDSPQDLGLSEASEVAEEYRLPSTYPFLYELPCLQIPPIIRPEGFRSMCIKHILRQKHLPIYLSTPIYQDPKAEFHRTSRTHRPSRAAWLKASLVKTKYSY